MARAISQEPRHPKAPAPGPFPGDRNLSGQNRPTVRNLLTARPQRPEFVRSPATSWPRLRGMGLDHIPRDHQPLDLARPFVDRLDAAVAQIPFDRELVDVAIATMDLHRLIAGPVGHLAGEELGHRGLAGERRAGFLEERR